MKRSRHDDNKAYLARMGRLSKTEMPARKDSYTPFSDKKARPVGVSLKPGEVQALVSAALAAGGPIKPGEAFEHFLAVVCDSTRFYAFHFITAAPRAAGARRRVIMLSERALHGSADRSPAFARSLIDYSAALGSARVMIDETSFCCDLARCLVQEFPGRLVWEDARVQWPPSCEGLQGQYLDNYALGFDRYTQAMISGSIKHPLSELLAGQSSALAPKADEQGRVFLNRPGERMERELNALCMVYLDEEAARLSGESEGARLAS